MESDESLYHATPQLKGRMVHQTVDTQRASSRKGDLMGISVCSETLGVIGKIDLYKASSKTLIERKYQLKQIFRGQIYQLWAQYFCLCEMSIEVREIAFYEISTNKMIPIPIPNNTEKEELKTFIHTFRNFNPSSLIPININKCKHCIYCNLCDKTQINNVYT